MPETTNLNRIRDALKSNNVVLTRGELRIAPSATSPAEVLPPVRDPLWDGGPGRSTAEEPVAIRLKPTTWAAPAWYEEPRYRTRLEAEVHAMQIQFPQARLAFLPGETLVWEVPVRTLTGGRYHVAIKYPRSFPIGEPEVYVLSSRLAHSPHQFSDGRLCLGHAFARETSALTTAAWATAWLSAYEVYQQTNVWPEFYPHVATGARS